MAQHAVALLSAGLDSSLAVAMSLEQGWAIDLAMTFDYGQRAAKRELSQAAQIAAYFGIPHRTLPLPWFRNLGRGGSLLQSKSALPHPGQADLSNLEYAKQSAKAVWIPNRNGVFLEIAAGLAEDQGASGLIVGFNREEAATFPDNSAAYMEALTRAFAFSTSNQVRVVSPTVDLDKTQIVAEAVRLKFPLNLVWSCYEGASKMCGLCESCKRLERALQANGVDANAYF